MVGEVDKMIDRVDLKVCGNTHPWCCEIFAEVNHCILPFTDSFTQNLFSPMVDTFHSLNVASGILPAIRQPMTES